MAIVRPQTETLEIVRDGERLRAFAAWLRRDDRRPAVVLIHDVRGLGDHYREVACRFAAAGFFCLALDLYSREGTPELPDMEAISRHMAALDDRRVLGDIECAVRYLAIRPEVRSRSIGIAGFCMGGQYALMAACAVPGLAACVSFYGMLRYAQTPPHKPESPLEMAARLQCPYLGLFGAEDALIPRADVKALEGTLRKAGKQFKIKSYAGAGHAFFNDTRPDAYHPAAAKDAWQRALDFFRLHLGS
ncbi:dienelactone hydrolase family protein [Candidatus Binatia bacterium]|nr:dienelactone hydrolase family protein [Candidatus Binatia bacterium]